MLLGQHDDVAEWDGGTRGEEQCLDEVDGHRPQGATTSRLRRRVHGSDTQPVSIPTLYQTHFLSLYLYPLFVPERCFNQNNKREQD